MARKDKGNYGGKHPPGTKVDGRIAEALAAEVSDETMSCAAAHDMSVRLNLPVSQIGAALDVSGIAIVQCQLGLFGQGLAGRSVTAAASVNEDFRQAIEKRLRDGELSCASAWEIADDRGIARIAVAAACETLKIRISACQLGAFR